MDWRDCIAGPYQNDPIHRIIHKDRAHQPFRILAHRSDGIEEFYRPAIMETKKSGRRLNHFGFPLILVLQAMN